jgi:predicted alpha/beta-hydrolase family hydrolase
MAEFLTSGAESARRHLLLAHGAGAPMTSPFMEKIATLLAERGLCVHRFEFAYMAARRARGNEGAGKRTPPPKAERLIGEYDAAVAQVAKAMPKGSQLLIGGKSMGGRVASLCADALFEAKRISGLVCLGYPFHPPGQPEKLRTGHLEHLRCPVLIVQGERDPFGTRAEVEAFRLSPAIRIAWMGDGDHDLGPRGGSGFTRAGNLAAAADAVAAFAESLPAKQAGKTAKA